jgi:hypothetical protein
LFDLRDFENGPARVIQEVAASVIVSDMHIKTSQEIEDSVPATYAMSAFFGFISGLADDDFVRYAVFHREHPVVRHVFFSDVQKRSDLPPEVVDEAVATLLAAVEEGQDRAKNETLIRYFPAALWLADYGSWPAATSVVRSYCASNGRMDRQSAH